MKKSLVMLVVLVSSLALAGSVLAFDGGWCCYTAPVCKPPVCVPQILCKGQCAGAQKLCGPCNPWIKWTCSWETVLQCPGGGAPAKMARKMKK